VISRHFRGYEIERCFLRRSVPTLYNRKPRRQTRPLDRESAPHRQVCNCATVKPFMLVLLGAKCWRIFRHYLWDISRFKCTNFSQKNCVFWVSMLCSLLKSKRYFGGIYHLHLESWTVNQIRNQHEVGNTQILFDISENLSPHNDLCEHLKYYSSYLVFMSSLINVTFADGSMTTRLLVINIDEWMNAKWCLNI
jgi:hypothetical protein